MAAPRKIFSVGIHDCKVTTFTVSGPGGSGKDTSNTGIRVRHEPSGAEGRCTEWRSQRLNRIAAFRRMAESQPFQAWAHREAARMSGRETPEERVERWMDPVHLVVEVRDEHGHWVKLP
jgi:protein subunit release factor B